MHHHVSLDSASTRLEKMFVHSTVQTRHSKRSNFPLTFAPAAPRWISGPVTLSWFAITFRYSSMSLLTNPLNQCVIPASELLLQIDLCLFEHFAQWFFNRCLLHSSTSLTCSKQLTQVSPSSPPVRSPSPTQSKKTHRKYQDVSDQQFVFVCLCVCGCESTLASNHICSAQL